MNKEKAILTSVIEECNKHVEMLDYAAEKLAHLLPFTAGKVSQLQKEDMSHLDQYIFRFSKLQDAIGQKLFKAVLRLLGEEAGSKSFIDIFNRLEQLGIIEDFNAWSRLRQIRNETAHEYDENKYELAEKLNKILGSRAPLKHYLESTFLYLKNREIL